MLSVKHVVETTASPSAIWKIWEDVTNWYTWDVELESSTINGPFVAGTTGTVTPKGGPVIQTILTEVVPLKSYVHVSKPPLARIIATNEIIEAEGKRYISIEIKFRGLLGPFFAFHIGLKKKAKALQAEMVEMVKKAEAFSV